MFPDAGELGVGRPGWGGVGWDRAQLSRWLGEAEAPNSSLLSTRLTVKLASSFIHAFDVSSWEGEQLGGGEGLQVGVERRCDET